MTLADQRQPLWAGRRYRVERWTLPDGRAAELVIHPGAAVVLPILDDGRVLMIRNFRMAAGTSLLELPCGTLEPPEPPLTCAHRELAEETGYRAAQMEPLLSFFSSPGIMTERMYAFVATGLTAGDPHPDPDERIQPVPLAWPEVFSGIAGGAICDGKTIVTLLVHAQGLRGGGRA